MACVSGGGYGGSSYGGGDYGGSSYGGGDYGGSSYGGGDCGGGDGDGGDGGCWGELFFSKKWISHQNENFIFQTSHLHILLQIWDNYDN